ncbi:hypothetical protein PFICI_05576 [Pestalotiopsis fici W106-1]|uniref:Major facilitator superfamily (MFS) profile domain-containing protein n=1 Tax=Pestalotiopsis fici (strain W106-1 / CGMCC3.15140) TaxID=1229662 RepID=W3XCC0_PESFW|nr:uncharacterized protein PFICI_05576 [Pestalotiopsis fici W106-1]ETS83700.1 hypothetical protein PFICI_05576 [Pestalotiopsis fici W106-1]
MAHRLPASYFDWPSPATEPTTKASKHTSLDLSGSVFLISSAGNVLRLPIPSDSPHDPLAWSWPRRIVAFCCLQLFSIVASFEVNIPGTLMPAFHAEFAKDVPAPLSISSLSSALTLGVGIGYLVNIPLATAIGRRPVVIMSALITAIATLAAGLAGSFLQLLVALAFQGFAVGGTIGMCLVMILDATFIHERPYALSLYWSIGSVIIKLLTLPMPYITSLATEWRTVYQVWFAVSLVSLVFLVSFVPETFYIRPPVAFDGRVLVQSSTEKVRIYDEWDGVPEDQQEVASMSEQRNNKSQPWADRFKVLRAQGTKWSSMRTTYAQMPFCFINPLIFWVSLLNACLLGAIIFLNLLQPTALLASVAAALDGPSINLNLGISGAVGALLALPFSGPLTAWLTRHLSLRTGGVRHAEVYLPGFAIPTIAGCLSVGLACAAVDRSWPAAWQYAASMLSMMSYNTGNVAIVLWMTEAFPRWASAALAVVLFTGNMVAFVIGLTLSPWIVGQSIIPQGAVLIGLIAGVGLIALPVAFWGKSVRQYIQCRWSSSESGALRPQ